MKKNYLDVLYRIKYAMNVETSSEVAEKLGITVQSVSGFTRKGFPKKQLNLVSELTNKSLAWLEYGVGPEDKQSHQEMIRSSHSIQDNMKEYPASQQSLKSSKEHSPLFKKVNNPTESEVMIKAMKKFIIEKGLEDEFKHYLADFIWEDLKKKEE